MFIFPPRDYKKETSKTRNFLKWPFISAFVMLGQKSWLDFVSIKCQSSEYAMVHCFSMKLESFKVEGIENTRQHGKLLAVVSFVYEVLFNISEQPVMGSGVLSPVFSFIDCQFYLSGRLKLKTPCKNKRNLVSNFFLFQESYSDFLMALT